MWRRKRARGFLIKQINLVNLFDAPRTHAPFVGAAHAKGVEHAHSVLGTHFTLCTICELIMYGRCAASARLRGKRAERSYTDIWTRRPREPKPSDRRHGFLDLCPRVRAAVRKHEPTITLMLVLFVLMAVLLGCMFARVVSHSQALNSNFCQSVAAQCRPEQLPPLIV